MVKYNYLSNLAPNVPSKPNARGVTVQVKNISPLPGGQTYQDIGEGTFLNLENLTANEVSLFDTEFHDVISSILANRDVVATYETNVDFILTAMDVAKAQFESKPFGGVNARSNEFGFQVIRPEHVGFSTWDGSNTATGWGNWIGSSASPVTNSSELFLAVLGLVNYDPSPKTSAIKATIGNTTFPVWYYENNQRLFNSVRMFELPKKIWIESEITYSIRKKRDAIGTDSLALMGLSFVEGPTLVLESPTPTSPTTLSVPVV